MEKRHTVVVLALGGVTYAGSSFAAVSANIPQLHIAWLQAFIFGFIIYAASAYRLWLGAILMIFPLVVLQGTFKMQHDELVGPAAIAEHGNLYFPLLYAADLLMLVMGVVGIYRGYGLLRSKRTNGAAG